ncbi:sigma-54 interaction domain-containing protein [Polluticaenibacter yanchengensis]|uniref:Sigma-54 dependent transcriptional regulator n=1 Tax=Polluticaenibacter yanchengensis TaxID=3014562 RepID=A0ABT4UHX3_9BACT|nr:sigma-54 dependent transcriptional regulator [Chitinophagaceae bacterium LY-5]
MTDIQAIKNRFGIIGNSPLLNHALNVAVQVAGTDLSVLINGESGVGKEVFSQIIHSLSARKHNNFIAVNCGAIPEGTIDSELFGHEKGAFTGAADSRKGYFETVNGGTIFLDEIGEMPLGTQARLLRVLESGEYIRVGSSKVQKTDVRVIAATNRDLLEQANAGKFRLDLYYRLNSVPIRIPALRDRKEDIPIMFRKFVIDFAERYKTTPVQLNEDAKTMLMNYPWRGNVRELKNIAEQISVLSREKLVTASDLQQFLSENPSNLPVLAGAVNTSAGNGYVSETTFATERDILYKFIFDMKKDLNELKRMFVELVQNPGSVKNAASFMNENFIDEHPLEAAIQRPAINAGSSPTVQPAQPFIIHNSSSSNTITSKPADYDDHEHVEESLNLMDMEKDLIIKALKKHKSKRKDAALDLGISERTLYRKLKEYDIEDM